MALDDGTAASSKLGSADTLGLQHHQQQLLLQASGVPAVPRTSSSTTSTSSSATLSLLSPQHSISAASVGMSLSAPLGSPVTGPGGFDSSKGMQRQEQGDMQALAAAAADYRLEQLAALDVLQKQLKQQVATLLPLM